MAEEPVFMVHSHNWQDDAWFYDETDGEPAIWREMPPEEMVKMIPHRSHDLAWWMALLLIVAGALLVITATAFLCDIIGL